MFSSNFEELGAVNLPRFGGTRIMMMPIMLGDMTSIPSSLYHYRDALNRLFSLAAKAGEVGYLTIDEREVAEGETHRRSGLHVDGVYHGKAGAWGGGGEGIWGGKGMITVSAPAGCRAWKQKFDGLPGDEGECDHLADQCLEATLFKAGIAYWCGALCVHESMSMPLATKRQFVRLSLPNTAPWFEGYTENPLGVLPTGVILPRREWL